MRLSTVIRWAGPVAIVSGVFTMFSEDVASSPVARMEVDAFDALGRRIAI